MKKLLIFGLMLIALPALAATVCADDDVIAIILDPEINGTTHTSNTSMFEWGAQFPYGSLWGIATCLDKEGTANTAVKELRSEDGELAVGGERNGSFCWCQMTHPAISHWVFRNSFDSINDCRSSCPNLCGSNVRAFGAFRSAMFGSLGS